MNHNHKRLSLTVLACTGALLAMPASDARAIDVGVSVNAGNAVSADANASVGGSSGVNADASANAGGGDNGLDANANARLGGGRGVDAGLNARIGGSDGLDANATASVRRGSGVDANFAIGRADRAGGSNRSAPDGTLSASQARVLEDFRARPVNEQRKMLVRCADISASSGSDSGLAGLCSLLQASVSR
ncbi:hypothetical protein [Rhizobium sp. CIAT894]|uniref:hypothetical protein n=1 Tax=Rhizobium sp. CIAT894 TaxID=2020312 RepID=UPI000A1FB5B1|nr:hypothetical protein [Rhizobium sp. CIAT894]